MTPTLLIVDDEKLVRWTLSQKCAEYGYQSVEAGTAEEALRVLQSDAPDAILRELVTILQESPALEPTLDSAALESALERRGQALPVVECSIPAR